MARFDIRGVRQILDVCDQIALGSPLGCVASSAPEIDLISLAHAERIASVQKSLKIQSDIDPATPEWVIAPKTEIKSPRFQQWCEQIREFMRRLLRFWPRHPTICTAMVISINGIHQQENRIRARVRVASTCSRVSASTLRYAIKRWKFRPVPADAAQCVRSLVCNAVRRT